MSIAKAAFSSSPLKDLLLQPLKKKEKQPHALQQSSCSNLIFAESLIKPLISFLDVQLNVPTSNKLHKNYLLYFLMLLSMYIEAILYVSQ